MSKTSTGSSSRRDRTVLAPPPAVPERPAQVRATLEGLGVVPSKRWGQSFLTDPFVADAEAALIGPDGERGILEIGGGLGILTAAILRRHSGPVTVVERDRRLAAFLRSTFGDRVRVLEGDALRLDLPSVGCAIGNLPYSVATPLLHRLFAARVPRVVFLVQREVAERFAAGPGSKEYGRPSILARLYGSVELYRTVGPEAFTPPPKVESRIAVHVARSGPLPVPDPLVLERAMATLFSSRRKQLGNLLSRLDATPGADDRLAEAAAWPKDWRRRRPEELPPEAYFALARALLGPDASYPFADGRGALRASPG